MTTLKGKVWTCKKIVNGLATFDVLNEATKTTREVKLYREGLELLFELGGTTGVTARFLFLKGAGFRFREDENEQIYLDGSSIGNLDYHPIDTVAPSDTDPSSAGEGERS